MHAPCGTHSKAARRAAAWPRDNATSRTRAVVVVTLARWHASGPRHSSAQLCRIQRRVTRHRPRRAGPGQGGSPALSHSILAQSGSFSPLNYDRQPASGERALRRPSPVSRRPPLAITDSIDRAEPSRAVTTTSPDRRTHGTPPMYTNHCLFTMATESLPAKYS